MSPKPLRILVVDDEIRLRRTLERTLRRIATVDGCGDVPSALAHLESAHYDVVVSDHTMPGQSGRELLGIVAERWPTCARILISAEAISLGAPTWQIFLAKPFSAEDLVAAIRSLTSHDAG